MKTSGKLLLIAGILSFTVAVFQAVISLSPSWSMFFGAPAKFVANTTVLYVSGEIIAVIFAIFGFYAISGAGYIRKLPLLRTILITIAGIYLLRGILVFLQLLIVFKVIAATETIPIQGIMSSVVSLIIGLVYLFGVLGYWKNLGRKTS